MKYYWAIIQIGILFLLVSQEQQALGQELISDINGAGLLQRQILKEYDGKNYILVIDRLDNVKVYLYEDGESSFLHSRHFIGIGEETYFRSSDQFLLYENTEGSIAYNFISDEELLFPYSDNLNQTSWHRFYKDEVVLSQSSSDYGERLVRNIDLNNLDEIIIGDQRDVLGNTKDYLLIRDYGSGSISSYYIYDKNSDLEEFVVEITLYAEQNLFENNYFIYKDGNTLVRYDISSGEFEDLFNYSSTVDRFKIFDSEDYIIYGYELNATSYLSVLNKVTHEIKTSEVDFNLERVSKGESEEKIIVCSNFECFIYDLIDNSFTLFETWFRDESLEIIGNRYVFHSYDYNYRLLDLQNNIDHDLGQAMQNIDPISISYFINNERLLINLDHHVRDQKDLWEIDLSTYEMKDGQEIIPYVNKGIQDGGHFVGLNEDVFLVEDHIHKVEENKLERINVGTLVESSYSTYNLIDSTLYWVENVNESVILCGFLDGSRKVIFELPQTLPLDHFQVVGDYGVTDEYIYFEKKQGFTESLVQVDRVTGEEKVLLDKTLLSGDVIFNHDNNTYINDDKVYYVDVEEGLIDVGLEEGLFILNDFMVFKNELFYSGSSRLYRLEENSSEVIFESEDLGLSSLFISGDYLFFEMVGNPGNFIYSDDGQNWFEVEFEENEQGEVLNGSYFALLKPLGTNTWETRFLDLESGKIINLPEAYKEYRFSYVFKYFDKTIVLGAEWSSGAKLVHVFEILNDENTIKKLTEFETSVWNLKSDFVQDDVNSILYCGSRILSINQELEFNDLSATFYGDKNSVDLVDAFDKYYFMAYDPELGRQVYSLSKEELISETPEINLNVFPNPSRHYISIELEDNVEHPSYRVISSEGETVLSGIYNGDVSIAELESGVYILMVEQENGEKKNLKFMKM